MIDEQKLFILEVKRTDGHIASFIFLDDSLLVAVFEQDDHLVSHLCQGIVFGFDVSSRALGLLDVLVYDRYVVLQLAEVVSELGYRLVLGLKLGVQATVAAVQLIYFL